MVTAVNSKLISVANSFIKTKKHRIFNTILGLNYLPKVDVTRTSNDDTIWIKHDQTYVPDFVLVWCDAKTHYRVYIHIADTKHDKTIAGYCICVIPNQLVAAGFCVLYNFIHKNRAGNKTGASE